MSPAPPILVGCIGPVFWMLVQGRGTFQNSIEVKRCFQSMMDRGVRNFVIDLDRCPTMDSTFLGALTGAALNLRESGTGQVSILNANERNLHLLSSLGLDHILEVDREGIAWAAERLVAGAELAACEDDPGKPGKDIQARHVLECHENLARVSDENVCRFRDVIDFLRLETEGRQQAAS